MTETMITALLCAGVLFFAGLSYGLWERARYWKSVALRNAAQTNVALDESQERLTRWAKSLLSQRESDKTEVAPPTTP